MTVFHPTRIPTPIPPKDTTTKTSTLNIGCEASFEAVLRRQNKRKKKQEDDAIPTLPEPYTLFTSYYDAIDTPASTPVAPCSSGIEELFSKLCTQMVHMDTSHSTTTTLYLHSNAFQNSILHGGMVVIEEFSTAPKIFNISITVSEQAATVIQSHLAGFLRLLHDGNYSFGVHRIDTSILTEKPSHRKITKQQDKQEEKDS